jgi:hypothetical protein
MARRAWAAAAVDDEPLPAMLRQQIGGLARTWAYCWRTLTRRKRSGHNISTGAICCWEP